MVWCCRFSSCQRGSNMDLYAIIKDLERGLIQGSYGLWGVAAVNSAFEGCVDTDLEDNPFDELTQPLPQATKRILNQETEQQIWKSFKVICSICEDYATIKEEVTTKEGISPEDKHKLFFFWMMRLKVFTKPAIADMMVNSVAEQGMVVFVVAVYVHLLVLQELATVDPAVEDPEQSICAAVIKGEAQQYLSHIIVVYNKCVEARKSQVSEFSVVGTKSDKVWTVVWMDDFDGQWFDDTVERDDSDPECLRKGVESLRNEYIRSVLEGLRMSLPFDFSRVTRTLERLRINPLPLNLKKGPAVAPPAFAHLRLLK